MANANVYSNVPGRNAPPKPKFAKKIQEIKIEDRDLSEIVIELGAGATVSGTVTVENKGELPKGISVVAVNTENELSVSDHISNMPVTEMARMGGNKTRTGSIPGRTKTGADNSFKLENISEGKTTIHIHVDEDYYVKSAKADGLDLLAGPVDLKDGDAIKNVQIVLSKDTGTLKGKILDGKNEPLKNADFILVPTDTAKQKHFSNFRQVEADANGDFEKKVPPGEYAIVFLKQGALTGGKYDEFFKQLAEAVKDAQKVSVEAGKTEKVTVRKTKK